MENQLSSEATHYNGAFIYKRAVDSNPLALKFISQAEGYIEPNNQGGFDYTYQYKDIWGNTRLTYSDADSNGAIDPNTEILREQNYYPFGLEHKGYNNVIQGVKNNFKHYQGQEFTEDLGLSTHEWKYRVSDPAIRRFWQIDPLAEDYFYNSTYAFQENKMGMGVELEGLELQRFIEGVQEMLTGVTRMINEPLNVNRQMERRGINGKERAEEAEIESREELSKAAGQTARGATETIKGGAKIVGETLEVTGDGISYAGIATAQPQIIAAGETISGTGTAINAAVDLSDGKSAGNILFEAGTTATFGQISKKGVKETQKVAGKKAVEKGENKVTEAVMHGVTKVYEEIFKNTISPFVLPDETTTVPIYSPIEK